MATATPIVGSGRSTIEVQQDRATRHGSRSSPNDRRCCWQARWFARARPRRSPRLLSRRPRPGSSLPSRATSLTAPGVASAWVMALTGSAGSSGLEALALSV